VSSEGALFEYASDEIIKSNLSEIANVSTLTACRAWYRH
jgi:hypothetical protein